MSESSVREQRYDAFISYSRKDIRFARLLATTLEKYKPPKELAVPQRYLEIFRDEDDMSGPDYRSSLVEHLRNSRKLIVLCSPHARSSDYVNEEIRIFAQLNGATNLIPILIAGIPDNENSAAQSEHLAFPVALREALAIPLAVNYRDFDLQKHRINQGAFYGSWYTLLANLFGISRSDIEQREKIRLVRTQRIRSAAIGGTIIFLVIALSVVFFFWRRAELQTRIALSRQLSAESINELFIRYDRSLLLAVAALRIHASPAAHRALFTVLQHPARRFVFFWGHRKEIREAVFDGNGRYLASAADDNMVYLWDIQSGSQSNPTGLAHSGPVTSISFHPTGKILATAGSDNSVRFWDLTQEKPGSRVIGMHSSSLRRVIFSPDGKFLATVNWNRTITLYDGTTGKMVHEIVSPHSDDGPYYSIAFSPDGTFLATCSGGGMIRFWSIPKLVQVGPPLNSGSYLHSIEFSPGAGQLLVSGGVDGIVRLWNVEQRTIRHEFKGHRAAVTKVAFSSDGRYIVSASHDNTLKFWDTATNESSKIFDNFYHRGVSTITLSENRPLLASGGSDGTLRVWDLSTRSAIGETPSGDEASILALAMDSTGRKLVSGYADGSVRLWDIAQRKALTPPFKMGTSGIANVAFANSETAILTASTDGLICLWDLGAPQPLCEPLTKSSVKEGKTFFSPDGRLLASLNNAGDVLLQRLPDLTGIGSPPERANPTQDVKFDNNGESIGYACRDASKSICLWNFESNPPSLKILRSDFGVRSLAFTRDARTIATGLWNNVIVLRDVTKHEPVNEPLRGHSGPVSGLLFSSAGDLLVSIAAGESSIRLWDLGKRGILDAVLDGHHREVTTLALSPDDKTLVSGGLDGKIVVWDLNPLSWQKRACLIANRSFTRQEWRAQVGEGQAYDPVCSPAAELANESTK